MSFGAKKPNFVVAKRVEYLLILLKSMKIRYLLLATVAMVLTSTALADIQSPPGHHFNWSRKLSRGIGNVLFGWLEYPNVWSKTSKSDGSIAAASDLLVEGTKRTLVRAVHGIYETATFPVASWKRTYRPTYATSEVLDNWWGYTQFAPELGSRSDASYSRSQSW
jgi:putative exosortase-associated protein (TIGR04073 family)